MVVHQRRIAMMELGRDPVMDKVTDKNINLRQRQVRTTDNSMTIVAVLSPLECHGCMVSSLALVGRKMTSILSSLACTRVLEVDSFCFE